MSGHTLTDLARKWHRSPRTLRSQIANGRLEATRRAHMWLVSEEEVARYEAESLGKPGRRAAR